MPDIWTKYPEIVRRILTEAGFKCNVEPRILARSANETCQIAKENFLGEIYIHDINTLQNNNQVLIVALVVLVITILILLYLLRKKRSKKGR